MSCSKETGPGYASPLDAMKNGPCEKLLYVVTVQPNKNESHGDYLSTVDVDPNSKTYCQVIYRTYTNRTGNEIHHSGWNTCSSCFNKICINKKQKRDKLILPCLNSDRIYIFDINDNERQPILYKEIDNDVLKKLNCTAPHTTHCLSNGNIMISIMGDSNGMAKCDYVLFDSKFNCIGTWIKKNNNNDDDDDETSLKAHCGYDFWYQPYFDVMVSSEWGAPKLFRRGFQSTDLDDTTQYGQRLNFFKWSTQKLYQVIDLGKDGTAPLEVRFMHNPKISKGFVGCCLYANVFHFYKNDNDMNFNAIKIIDVPAKKIHNKITNEIIILNGMMTDILLSLDDKYLYLSNWLHGDVRQYNIENPYKPILSGQIFLGGKILNDDLNIDVIEDIELKERPLPCIVKGKRLQGGPQMLQLSLDGKRLYVSTSLFSQWDKQFYPEMIKSGGTIVQIDCDIENGGMKLNENFLVDFCGKNEPYGPTLPHEMRYPGGDCTSDIWLADD